MRNIIITIVFSVALVSCFKKEATLTENTRDSTTTTVPIPHNTASSTDSATIIPTATVTDSAAIAPVKTSMTYDEARRENTSEAWKQFLSDNPNYENREEIEENIIRAQVHEISADSQTGQMPTSERISSSNKSVSTIMVENTTSCDLMLLYSGTDAKRVTIAPNSKQKVSLTSGSYSVAANACGYNYAGSETLSGDYNVVYYISTVRY